MNRYDIPEVLMAILLLIVVGGVALFLAESIFMNEEITEIGTIVGLQYSPSESSVGVAPIVGGEGGVAIVSSSKSEKWIVLVDIGNDVVSAKAEPKEFYQLEIGERIKVTYIIGKITGLKYDTVVK